MVPRSRLLGMGTSIVVSGGKQGHHKCRALGQPGCGHEPVALLTGPTRVTYQHHGGGLQRDRREISNQTIWGNKRLKFLTREHACGSLYTTRWFSSGRAIGRTVPSTKPKQFG